jgi:hypothetical protein
VSHPSCIYSTHSLTHSLINSLTPLTLLTLLTHLPNSFHNSCDVNNARRHVQRCIARAEAQTLTRDDYTSTQEAVRRRSMAWAAPLACLGLVAFYNSVCFLVLQYGAFHSLE